MAIDVPPLGRTAVMSDENDRDQRQHDRDGVGGRVVEVLVAVLDVQRQRLGLARDAAGDDADGAELAERARGREHDAVDDAPSGSPAA